MSDWDVIVIGARCAGAPTAMLLARQGLSVLLVDRATFPSDTVSTHNIGQGGVILLKRWGLLKQVQATGVPRSRLFTLHLGDMTIPYRIPRIGGVSVNLAPRRTLLDAILVDAAADAGAEVREGFSVRELLFRSGTVVGVAGGEAVGKVVKERAEVVVGADGVHSTVAGSVQPPTYDERASMGFGAYAYWSGVATDGVELHLSPGRAVGVFPTNDDLTCVYVAWPAQEAQRVRRDLSHEYLDALQEAAPSLAERVAGGRRHERFRAVSDLPNIFRRPWGAGWALVGDAGYHKDPVTGHGITDAFRDAELLTSALVRGLGGEEPLSRALVGYELARNGAAREVYEATCEIGSLDWEMSELVELFARLGPALEREAADLAALG